MDCGAFIGNSSEIHRSLLLMVTGTVRNEEWSVDRKKPGRKAEPGPKRRIAWPSWTGFRGKTLWDWLQLLSALAIPIVLAAAGFWFTWHQEKTQREVEDRRAQAEQRIEDQRTQDAALQAYLEYMSQLILEKDLRGSEAGSAAHTLARARTLTVLSALGPDRKANVLQFLYESGLIASTQPIVKLEGADLSYANLSNALLQDANLAGADLHGANLSDAFLPNANLTEADLHGANLSDARLEVANLQNTNLSDANLSGATLSGAYFSWDPASGTLPPSDESKADLDNADLSYAFLLDAHGVTKKQLEQQAASLEGATMPDGSKHP
jgi:uncharacterized protein YjbI with pentapeptide repeats